MATRRLPAAPSRWGERFLTPQRRLGAKIGVSGLTLALAVLLSARWSLERIRDQAQRTVRSTLTTVLRTTHEAASRWWLRQKGIVAEYAASPSLEGATRAQLQLPRQTATLKGSPNLAALQSLLRPVSLIHDFDGFWLLAPAGYTVAASHSDQVGPGLPAGLTAANLRRALRGPEFIVDARPSAAGSSKEPHSVFFALAPVRDQRSQGIAVLAVRFDPGPEFGRIALQGRFQETGRTFLYDRQGRLLARSSDPGSDTSSARDLVQKSGIDLEGYDSPRGGRVVGAWTWDDAIGLGVATEMSEQEAYQVVATARRAIGLAILLLTMLALPLGTLLLRDRRRSTVLAKAQRRLAAILESTTDFVCFADAEGRILYVNDAGQKLLGEPGEFTPRAVASPPPAWAHVMLRPDAIAAAMSKGVWSGETTILTVDGRELTLSQVILAHRTGAGEVEFLSTIARDMSEQARLKGRLFEEKERAEVTLGSIADAVITTDALGLIEYLNPVAEQLTGWHREEALGRPVGQVFHLINETTREPTENPALHCLRERGAVGLDQHAVLLRRDGQESAIDNSAAPIRDRDHNLVGAVMVFHDVSQARSMARQLAYRATHDFLTGLVNRYEFERRLSRTLVRARQDGSQHALCYLDLDQFKVVNDTCGHVAGDELLRQLGAALRTKVRRSDTLARLGGDEFGVLLEHCQADQARRLADELLQVVREFRFTWEGRPFSLRASVGLAPLNAESESIATVLRDADAACYAAKDSGRNRLHVYAPHDAELAQRHGEMQWVSRLTVALEEDRFRLYAQPIVPLSPVRDQRLRCEVLIRLQDPDGSLTAPGAFIPAAERYNLMPSIDRWVVRKVAEYYAERRDLPLSDLPLCSVNLSGASLNDPALLDFIRDELDQRRVSPRHLCFEITETAAIAHLGTAVRFIKDLRKLGCSFALDDFGSGLSSFAYLQSLPVDYLKIAASFTQGLERNPIDFAMVEAINRVGHVMSLQTVAEGVESEASVRKLRKIGVDYAQGYALAGVVAIEDLAGVLAKC